MRLTLLLGMTVTVGEVTEKEAALGLRKCLGESHAEVCGCWR